MLTIDAVKHFRTKSALARALGLTKGAITFWGDVVPRGRAFELQVLTGGALRVDETLYLPSTGTSDHRSANA